MRWIRIYVDQPLHGQATITLQGQAARHLTQVLRLRAGDRFSAFNGDGYDYPACLTQVRKDSATAEWVGQREPRPAPPLPIVLGQALIKGERMDWAIQKAVELGVSAIAPLTTKRTEVRLSDERRAKRLAHWHAVIISACEQCGRADVPAITAPQAWYDWADSVTAGHRLVLIPGASDSLAGYPMNGHSVAVAIGPEGGWSDSECAGWQQKGFHGVHLGRLVLRAETAALAALAVLASHAQ